MVLVVRCLCFELICKLFNKAIGFDKLLAILNWKRIWHRTIFIGKSFGKDVNSVNFICIKLACFKKVKSIVNTKIISSDLVHSKIEGLNQ